VLGQHGAAERVALYLPHDGAQTGDFKSELEAADAAEE
jgi:hypothetical protein